MGGYDFGPLVLKGWLTSDVYEKNYGGHDFLLPLNSVCAPLGPVQVWLSRPVNPTRGETSRCADMPSGSLAFARLRNVGGPKDSARRAWLHLPRRCSSDLVGLHHLTAPHMSLFLRTSVRNCLRYAQTSAMSLSFLIP